MTGLSARTKLGHRLRACRKAAGITQVALAGLLDVSQSTISKIESGEAHVPEALLRGWLDQSAADDAVRAEALELAASTTEITDWQQLHARGWEAHQASYAELEQAAASMRAFQNSVVPGLLQTAAYTSSLLSTVGLGPEDVGVGVTARLSRQSVLYKPTTRLRAVITEAVLRHRLVADAVRLEQLQRLIELSDLPTVELGIIPIDTDMPGRYGPSFDLFEGLDGTDAAVVTVELESGEVREEDPTRIAAYRRRHDRYWEAALTGTEAATHVARLAADLRDQLFHK